MTLTQRYERTPGKRVGTEAGGGGGGGEERRVGCSMYTQVLLAACTFSSIRGVIGHEPRARKKELKEANRKGQCFGGN